MWGRRRIVSVGLDRKEPNIGPDGSEAGDCSSGSVVNERKRDKFSVCLLQQRHSKVDCWFWA